VRSERKAATARWKELLDSPMRGALDDAATGDDLRDALDMRTRVGARAVMMRATRICSVRL